MRAISLRLGTTLPVFSPTASRSSTSAGKHPVRPSASEILGTERTSQFAVNTIQFSLRNVDWDSLKHFYVELSRRTPYIGLEQFSTTVAPGNASQLNVMLRVSSVEISQ